MKTSESTGHARPDEAEVLRAIDEHAAQPTRPLLLTGGTVISMDPLLGDWERADVLLGGSVVVGVGPGLFTAAGDDNMVVIDVSGMVVLPASVGEVLDVDLAALREDVRASRDHVLKASAG